MTLEGITWRLVAHVGATGEPTPVPDDVLATAAFADGEVTGSTGCNRYHATCAVDGAQLKVFGVAATMRACPSPWSDVEAAFVAQLERVVGWAAADGGIHLAGEDGEALLWFEPLVSAPLVGTTWTALGINNGRGAVAGVLAGPTVTAVFGEDGRISGSAGCNRYTGTFTTDGAVLAVGQVATTRRACAQEGLMEQEAAFVAALGRVATLEIEVDRLELRALDGALQVLFEARDAEAELTHG
jgi:heat shock protein HslJ